MVVCTNFKEGPVSNKEYSLLIPLFLFSDALLWTFEGWRIFWLTGMLMFVSTRETAVCEREKLHIFWLNEMLKPLCCVCCFSFPGETAIYERVRWH